MVFFSGGKGGGELVNYGYKGKGMTTHLLVDGDGNPLSFEVTSAKDDERQQVEKLIDPHLEKLQKLYTLHQVIPILEADKGYDSEELRDKLLKEKFIHSYLGVEWELPKRRKSSFVSLKNGDGRLRERYLGYKESLEESLYGGKGESNIGKAF